MRHNGCDSALQPAARGASCTSSGWLHRLGVGLCIVLLAACSGPGIVKPTVKIGLSAPFEGLHRDLGYAALHAVQLAVRERNASGGVGQRYLVELVALNDLNEVGKAVEQARKMAVDPGVLGVLGGMSQETALAAAEYESLGLTFLAPSVDITVSHHFALADTGFAERYAELSGSVAPDPAAMWAYSAANHLLDAMDVASHSNGHPTRSEVQSALGSLDR